MNPYFVAVDNDRLTNASTDVATKSLSTWLENRIDANNKCIVANSHCISTYKPYGLTSSVTSRYWASPIHTCFHVGIYDISENTNKIKVLVVGTAITGNVELHAEVHVFRGGTITGPIAATEPLLFGTSDINFEMEMLIDPKEITANKCIVSVWMRSASHSASIQTLSRNQITWSDPEKTTHDGFKERSGFDAFGPDYIITDDTDGRTWQLIKKHTVTGKGGSLDGLWWGIQPLDGKPINLSSGTANNQFSKRQISSFYPGGVFVEFERNPYKSTFDYSAKIYETMAAQTPVLGQHVSQHAFNIDAEHQVYRMQHVGAEEDDYPAIEWQTEVQKPWWQVRQGGVFAAPNDWQVKQTVGFDIDWSDTKIEVSGLVLGVELNALWTADNDKVGYPPAPNTIERFAALGPDDPRKFAAPQANDSVQRIKGSVPIRIVLRQLVNNDLDIFGSTYNETVIDDEIDITFWRATPDYTRPLLRSLSFGYHGDVFTNDRSTIATLTKIPHSYYHTEGWLQNLNAHNDIQYLTPFVFSFDPPAGFDKTKPMIAQVLLGNTDKTSYFSTVQEAVSVGLAPDGTFLFNDTRMFVHFVSWSIATRGII